MERARQYLELNHSQIEQACRQYFQNNGSLQGFEILSGGAVNTTFKIRWDDEWFVLRFYVRGKSFASIEKRIYQLVEDTVHVPEMLFASSGNEVYPFAIFRFCKKSHIYDVDKAYSHKLSYDLGYTLARIHAFRFFQAGLFGRDLSMETLFRENSSPYFECCLEHLIPGSNVWARLGEVKAQQVIDFIEENRECFPVIRDGGCLVHSDFKPVNLLWDEQDGVTVLDWEFAHIGHGLIDFGILLRHYQDFPLNIEYLGKGYKENGGDLCVDWIRRAGITDFINIIQLLDAQVERPKFFQSLLNNLDFIMKNWEDLDKRIRGK